MIHCSLSSFLCVMNIIRDDAKVVLATDQCFILFCEIFSKQFHSLINYIHLLIMIKFIIHYITICQ